MIKQIAVIALGVAIASSSAHAQQVLLKDTFDTENSGAGATQLNYNAFANWNVTGQVDLVKSGAYGITCSGSCVDLDGSTGPGTLTSKLMYSFNAGDVMRFTARIGGAQRAQSTTDNWELGVQFDQPTSLDFWTASFGSGFSPVGTAVLAPSISMLDFSASNSAFRWVGMEWRATRAGSLRLAISTTSADAIGPILDEVLLERTAATVPEPAGLTLVATGLIALGGVLRRRRA